MYEIVSNGHRITYTRGEAMMLLLLIVWEGIWKGIALWKAGRNRQLVWFVVILILNTAGLLEIAYLLFFQSKPKHKDEDKK